MRGEKYGVALKTIPFSVNKIMRYIESISENIRDQMLTRIKRSPKFAVQIDQSGDVGR
jgi:hypothetical protein